MSFPHERLGTDLLYSACWEDLAVARQALRIPRGGVVVTIASAGDNTIGLLLGDPARIIAVDLNPAQAALTELKLAALRHDPDGLAGFVGGLGAHARAERVALAGARTDRYDTIRRTLSPLAVRYWDAHPAEIAGGVVRAGRFERYLSWFRRCLLPVVPGRRAVRRMLQAHDVAEQRRVYRESWDSPAWRAMFRAFFSRRLLAAAGRHPALFEQAQTDRVGAHFLARAIEGLTATPISTNPYVTFMLAGRYRLPYAAPDYLRPENAALLAARVGRVTVQTSPLVDALRELPDRSVDGFYLSDIFELAEPAAYEECLREIARVGRPGSRLCYWNNLVDRTRPASLADRLATQDDLAARLHAVDRAFIYSRLVVEEVRDAR